MSHSFFPLFFLLCGGRSLDGSPLPPCVPSPPRPHPPTPQPPCMPAPCAPAARPSPSGRPPPRAPPGARPLARPRAPAPRWPNRPRRPSRPMPPTCPPGRPTRGGPGPPTSSPTGGTRASWRGRKPKSLACRRSSLPASAARCKPAWPRARRGRPSCCKVRVLTVLDGVFQTRCGCGVCGRVGRAVGARRRAGVVCPDLCSPSDARWGRKEDAHCP